MTTHTEPLIDDALRERLLLLTLEEKVKLLTGRDFWTTWPIERIGLRRMLVSDGPSGVRGEQWDERSPSLNLPSATALAASWDLAVADRYGAVSAAEARRKGVDVVLGPTINLHRSPLGGRHFEAFSEDPLLTAELAASYVAGVQRGGVGATPKHYVANDFETDRFTTDVVVDERTLREVYLFAFEKAIEEARAWAVMSAYNSVNGVTATENDLLQTPLRSEWGFDGVVISDWGAVRSVDAARAEQDLAMPGPGGPWGEALVAAVRAGEVDEATIDRKVIRLLRLAARVGALEGIAPEATAADAPIDGVAFARVAAAEGAVLVRNEGILPLEPAKLRRIAVIGHNARDARTQGGGSATVIPECVVSPLEGIRAAFPDAEVTYALGAVVQEGVADLAPASMTNPVTGAQGARVRFFAEDGTEVFAEDRFGSALVYFSADAPIDKAHRIVFSTWYTSAETGTVRFGFASVGHGRVFLDGALLIEETVVPVGTDLGAAFLSPPSVTAAAEVQAGVPTELRIEFEPDPSRGAHGSLSLFIGTEPDRSDPDGLIAEAADAAAMADAAIVVVGTNAQVESEGIDRDSLALPGRQDELVEAIVAANPRTIVVVNAGAPVELPWRDRVAAILLSWFGGQEYGNALADVLTGAREPGGRLPTTWPGRMEDVPVIDVTPRDGAVRYDEGIHIGYRAWLRAQRTPAYPFGHGLGYARWSYGEARIEPELEGLVVRVSMRNVGSCPGKQVVQVYASRPDSAIDRPVRWLAGFAVIRAEAGEESEVRIRVPRRAFAHWENGWQYEPGVFELLIGTSATDIVARIDTEV